MEHSESKRLKVKEVTPDITKPMEPAVKTVFKNTLLVTDRFQLVKLEMEALQHIRINQRSIELDKKNETIKIAKQASKKYESVAPRKPTWTISLISS